MRRTAIYYKYLNVGCEWEMVLKPWKVAGEDKGGKLLVFPHQAVEQQRPLTVSLVPCFNNLSVKMLAKSQLCHLALTDWFLGFLIKHNSFSVVNVY